MRRSPIAIGFGAALALGLTAGSVSAQMGPGGFGSPGGMQPPAPGGGAGQPEKEEGPAEEAPEENRPADLEPLGGYAEQNRRRMQIFELGGYLRLRADYMHDFFLGQGYTSVPDGVTGSNYGLPPFPVPLNCPSPASTMGTVGIPSMAGSPAANCPAKNTGGANLRFRLEPTINVTDQVRVHAQIDVLDNTILGSTPDSLVGIEGYNRPPADGSTTYPATPTSLPGSAPVGFLSTTQDPPTVGQNGFLSSVRAKRAWAEVDGEFGSIRFGRMPWHWGRGIFYNDGNCPDCDVGTTVDRVMGLTTVYGHQFAAAWDLGAQGPTTQQLTLGRNDPSGYPYDLGQNDDVLELMGSITRIDSATELRERIDRGDMVVNYGAQFVYRNQGNIVPAQNTVTATAMNGPQPQSPDQLAPAKPYGAWSATPDLWFKLYYRAFTLELEGIAVLGGIDHPYALSAEPDAHLAIRQFGWVAAGELRLFRDSLFVGLETGGATGDSAEEPGQYLNYRWKFVQQPRGDHTLSRLPLLARLPRRRDPVPPHPRHGHQRHLRQAADVVLVRSGALARHWVERVGGPQHGPGAGLDSRQLGALRSGDDRRSRVSEHRGRVLRRVHLGHPLADGRARPAGQPLGPGRGRRQRRANPPHLHGREVLERAAPGRPPLHFPIPLNVASRSCASLREAGSSFVPS